MEIPKRRVKFSEKFMIFVCFMFTLVCTPVGLAQYVEWSHGNEYSLPFMFMGMLFPLMLFAHILKVRRR